jgi:hypothetical protein
MNHESFSTITQVYFVGAPMTYNGVWLFPVGLNDALWFIYRERQPDVRHVGRVEEAKAQMKQRKTSENFIFRFDSDGKIVREL